MKKILILALSIFLISFASSEIIIQPSPLDVNTQINQQSNYTITITNNYTFDIFNFTFGNLSNYGFTFPEIYIPKNTSKVVNFGVKTTSSYHTPIASNVAFKFYVDLPEEITTYDVNITAFGFNPNFLTIRDGDTVVWHNYDDISHRVFSNFDYQIPVNGTASHTFAGVGTTSYYDPNWVEFSSFRATIEVVNRTSQQVAHNPNYDTSWTVNLNSVLNPTFLSISNSGNNYSIEYQKFKRGVFTIVNNGTERAELIKLSSDSNWVTFNRNDFNLETSAQEFVEYTITPIILETNQTDKTYSIPIKIKASNSEEYVFNIVVYVPYKEVISSIGGSDVDTLNWLQNVFCPKFPTSFLCNQSVMSGANGTGGSGSPQVQINVSAVDYIETKKAIARMEDSATRRDNEVKELKDTLSSTLPSIQSELNQTRADNQSNKDFLQDKWNFIWIIGLFGILTFAGFYLPKIIRKKKFSESLTRGNVFYRK